jgi:preprotein translocase subunit SecA
VVAQAGQRGQVTIATNMAGRGTDIVLGEGVVELGGLHIIGTERHEARRIDNQLRGRSGRQGDPGSSRFYLSLEDDFLRLFAAPAIAGLMNRMGVEEDEPISHPMLTRAIESAQKKMEARNFEIRKQLLQYDDVMNAQREIVYRQRFEILTKESLREEILDLVRQVIVDAITLTCPANQHPEEWDLKPLVDSLTEFCLYPGQVDPDSLQGMGRDTLTDELMEIAEQNYQAKEQALGEENMRQLERVVFLRVVDSKWMEHLDAMDSLRDGVGLRAYGQLDPLVEYKREAYNMYQEMLGAMREELVRILYHIEVADAAPTIEQDEQPLVHVVEERHGDEVTSPAHPFQVIQGGLRDDEPGRNDPCWCGSGKKYKRCHGLRKAK